MGLNRIHFLCKQPIICDYFAEEKQNIEITHNT